MDVIYNLTKLSLNKLTREKQHYIADNTYVAKKYRPCSDMTDLFLQGTSNRHKAIVPYASS